jgi:hypothetical protein
MRGKGFGREKPYIDSGQNETLPKNATSYMSHTKLHPTMSYGYLIKGAEVPSKKLVLVFVD